MAYIPPLNGGRLNASIGGNSTSAGAGYAMVSTGTVVLAGGNNITLSQNGPNITISGANAPSGSINFSASNASANLASVTFSNSNGVSFGLNAGVITASHNALTSQSNQALSAGNGSFAFQTASFSNANGISFSTSAGSAIVASHNALTSQSNQAVSGANGSFTFQTLSLSNANGISFGTSAGSAITASYTVPTQTNQTLSQAITGNTTGNTSGMSVDARSLTMQGLGAASVGLSTSAGGSSVIISAPVQSVQTQNLMTVNGTQGNVSISGGANVTVGNNASTITISAAAQTVQTQNLHNLTLSGNTAGVMAQVSSGTLTLAGGNNITLSQNGNAVTISGGNGGGTMGLYGVGNTTQNSSTTVDVRSVSLNGLGAMTVGYSGGSVQLSAPQTSSLAATGAASISVNGGTISIGAPAFSAGISTLGNTAGTSGTQSNQIVFAGGNNITLSQSTNAGGATVSISGPNALTTARASNDAIGLNTAQTNVTWTVNSSGLSLNAAGYAGTGFSGTNASGTLNSNGLQLSVGAGGGGGIGLAGFGSTYTSGNITLSADGALTLSGSTNSVLSLSVPATSSLSATGIVSLSTNGSTISLGAPAFSAGISNIGNTNGTSGTVSNQFILAGGNNITLSQLTGAGGNTLSIIGGAGGGGGAALSAGTQSVSTGTVAFANSNGITFGMSGSSQITASHNALTAQSNNAAQFTNSTANSTMPIVWAGNSNGSGNITMGLTGSTVTASGPTGGGGANFTFNDGANSFSSGSVVFSDANGVNFGINGNTITASVTPELPTLSRFEAPTAVFTTLPAIVNNSLSLQHIYVPFNVFATEMKIGGSVTAGTHTSASTGSVTINLKMGIYTLNGSTLQLATSASGSLGFGVSSSNTSSINGMRQFTVTTNSIYMTPGEYWIGAILSTATNYASNPLGFTLYGNSAVPTAASNAILSPMGVAVTSSPRDVFLFEGMYGTVTTALPTTIQGSQINNSAVSNVQRAQFYHVIYNATY